MQTSSTLLTTPIGQLIATATDTHLIQLNVIKELAPYSIKSEKYTSPILVQTAHELSEYFAGKRKQFSVPIKLSGSRFQITTWQALMTLPYGTTVSYRQLAHHIERPTACRAVANANGANNIIIIVPCHRVIQSNGSLGGFSAGIEKKQFLLELEKKFGA